MVDTVEPDAEKIHWTSGSRKLTEQWISEYMANQKK